MRHETWRDTETRDRAKTRHTNVETEPRHEKTWKTMSWDSRETRRVLTPSIIVCLLSAQKHITNSQSTEGLKSAGWAIPIHQLGLSMGTMHPLPANFKPTSKTFSLCSARKPSWTTGLIRYCHPTHSEAVTTTSPNHPLHLILSSSTSGLLVEGGWTCLGWVSE